MCRFLTAIAAAVLLMMGGAGAQETAPAGAAGHAPASPASPQDSARVSNARLSLFVFQDGVPQPGFEILAGQAIGETDSRGALFFQLPPGQHELTIRRGEMVIATLPLDLIADESAQLLVTVFDDGREASIVLDSSNQGQGLELGDASQTVAAVRDPGTLSGKVFSVETGEGVSGARIFISGTPVDLQTGPEGEFEVNLPPGSYSISILHGEHATLTRDGIEIISEETTPLEVELVPAGLELPEFVVLEPFVEGSLASVLEEQRTSSGVANVLGAEAISRAGDGDAAGALKRVTGLTLVDGKYVYVRGLGERYSSVLLNGANIPSPDPTRRVVPLSLFPADILASVLVQKSFESDMPAEFGGGTINLRTTGIPASSFYRVGISSAWHNQSTWDSGGDYRGGDDDFLGKDDGTRSFPTPDFSLTEATGQELAPIYNNRPRKLPVDYNLTVSGGWRGDWGDLTAGALAVYAYDQDFRNRFETRDSFFAFLRDDEIQLTTATDFDVDITRRFINITNYLSAGLDWKGLHQLSFTGMRLRNSEDETRVTRGLEIEGNIIEETFLEFESRELSALQLNGKHVIPRLSDLEISWFYSDADTFRDAPDARRYSYTDFGEGDFVFTGSNTANERFWSFLEDNATNYAVDLRLPLEWDEWSLALGAGINDVEKDRNSFIRRFRFECRSRDCRNRDLRRLDPESVLDPANISPAGGFQFFERTLSSDTYFADQTIDGKYLSLDATWHKLRLYLGIRDEVFDQNVTTVDRFDTSQPVVSEIRTDEKYPGVSATWAFSDATQLRLSFSETATRPEFREASTSLYTDPELDLNITGNPQLQPVNITNYDLRWEHYFDSINNISVALFRKELENPIELIFLGGSAQATTVGNVEAAEINGMEVEFYRSLEPLQRWWDLTLFSRLYVAGNYSYIDSSVEITAEQAGRLTNLNRELQGQSPYVFNLQIGYDDEDRGIKATLLYNTFGERISFVGAQGVPDIFEQPTHVVDFVFSQTFLDGSLKLGFKARNLLDDRVLFTQGDEFTRTFKRGREFSVGLDWRF